MSIELQDLAEYLRMDKHDYLAELRLSLNPEQDYQDDLDAFEEELSLSGSETESVRAALAEYCENLYNTKDETLDSQSRDKELEPERYQPYREFFSDCYPSRVEKVFFTEFPTGPAREFWKREAADSNRTIRILMVEEGYIDLALTSRVHSQYLQVSRLNIKGVPHIKVGMILVDMENGECTCKVYGCNAKMRLTNMYENGIWSREYAEGQILQIFAHLGSHPAPRNPWPKFTTQPRMVRDSDEEKMANRVLTLSRQKTHK